MRNIAAGSHSRPSASDQVGVFGGIRLAPPNDRRAPSAGHEACQLSCQAHCKDLLTGAIPDLIRAKQEEPTVAPSDFPQQSGWQRVSHRRREIFVHHLKSSKKLVSNKPGGAAKTAQSSPNPVRVRALSVTGGRDSRCLRYFCSREPEIPRDISGEPHKGVSHR